MKLRIISESGNVPAYATEGASGMDLKAYLQESMVLQPMERRLVPTGIYVEIPQGYEGQVRARSGLAIKKGIGLVNGIGTIDSDYRGELKVPLINWGAEPFEIQNGDRIEILTSQNSKGPSRDWLNIVKSTQAKSKINSWFKKEYKEDNIIRGKDLISAYCKSKGINLPDIIKPKYQQIVQKKYGFRDWDAVLAAIGHGGLKEGQVVNRLLEEYEKEHKKEITDENILEKISEANKQRVHIAKSKSGIVVKGINDMAVRFSKCCNPVPGDEIVGFVTRGRGMSIHRTDCINIINLSDVERSRLITAEWEDNDLEEGGQYLAELKIFADDRRGLLLDVSKVFTEEKIDVKSMNTRTSKKGTATMEMGFVVHGREELNRVIGKLRQIENVIDIERTTG